MTYALATALTVRTLAQAGTDLATMQSPDGTNGNKISCDLRTMVRFKNTNAAARNVTFETPGTIKGLAIADQIVNVPATTGDVGVPIIADYFQPGTQDVFFSYDATAGLTVDVYRLPTL